MNKEKAIKKINAMGQVGQIISIIIEVVLGIAAILILIATIALIAIPKDFLSVETSTQVNTIIDLNVLPGMSAIDSSRIEEELAKGSLTVNDDEMAISDVAVENGIMNVSTEVSTISFNLKKLMPLCLSGLLNIVCAFISVLFVCKLCKSIKKCASPFDSSVISNLKAVAFSLIPLALLDSITESIASAIQSGNHNMQFTVNLVMVFAILIILALAYIFKYGGMLQQESDETL